MSADVRRGYATNGGGNLIVHFWQYDCQIGMYVSLCGNKLSRAVANAADNARECKSCRKIVKAKEVTK